MSDPQQDRSSSAPALEGPEDLLSLTSPGSVHVITLPDFLDAHPVVDGLCTALRHPARSLLITGAAGREDVPTLSLSDAASAGEALKPIRKTEGLHTVLIELTGGLGGWASRSGQMEEFFEKTVRHYAEGRSRLVWVCARRYFSPKQWAALRGQVDSFFEVLSSGPWLYGQFLAARGVRDATFFLPRSLKLTDRTFRLGKPLLPPPGKEESGVDAALELYRQAFSGAGEGMVLFDPRGRYREANPRALEMFGLESADFAARPLSGLLKPASYHRALRGLIMLRRKNRLVDEFELVRPSGRGSVIAVTATLMSARLALAVMRDVSADRKRQRERQSEADDAARLALATPMPQALFVARKLVWANQAFRSLYAALLAGTPSPTLQQLLGRTLAAAARGLQSVTEDQGPGEVVFRNVELAPADDLRREYDLYGTRAAAAGRQGVLLTLVDAGDREARLRDLEEKLRTIRSVAESEAAPASVVREGTVLWVNRGFAALLGLATPEDVRGREVAQLLAPRDRNTVPAKLAGEGLEGEEVAVYEYSALSAAGKAVRVEASTQRIEYEGRPAGLTFHRNVSGKLKSTEELRQRLDETNRLEKILASCRTLLDPDSFAVSALEASLRHLGFDGGVVYGLDDDGSSLVVRAVREMPEQLMASLTVQSLQEGVTGFAARTLEPLHLLVREYPAHLPYRSLFEAAGYQTVLYVPLVAGEMLRGIMLLTSGRVIDPTDLSGGFLASTGQALGQVLDVALRYRALVRSEALYHTVTSSIPDITYSTTSAGSFVLLGPQVERLLLYPAMDFYSNPDLWRQCVHPDDRTTYSERVGGQASGRTGGELVYRMLPKGKAAYRWMRDAFTYRFDAEGKVAAVDGIVTDITDRVEREEDHPAGGAADAFESLQEGVVVLDLEMRVTGWNKAMERITRLPRQSVAGTTLDHLLEEHPLLGVLAESALQARQGKPVDRQDVPQRQDGFIQYFWLRCSPVYDAAGGITGVVGTVSEVTARKQLEEELAQSESTLRSVIDSMGDALIITDLEGQIVEVNREFTRTTGYVRNEVLGLRLPYPWIHDESMGAIVAWISSLREEQDLRDFDMTWRRKDGHRLAISLNTTLLRNPAGKPVAMLNLARNISERKALADELASKNRHIEMLNRIISAANASLDVTTVFETAAGEVSAMLPCDVLVFAVLSDDRRSMVVRACSAPGGGERLPPGTVFPLERTLAARVVATAGPVIVEDLQEEGRDHRMLLPAPDMRSAMSIPVMLHERVLGVLEVGSREPGVYSPRTEALLQPIADQLGPALQNALLYAEVQAHVVQIRSLYELGEGLTGAVDTGSILAHVAAGALRTVIYDRLVFATALREGGGLRLEFVVDGVEHPGDRVEASLHEEEQLQGLAPQLLTGLSVIGEHGTILAVPVRGKERCHGALLALREGGPAYRDTDLRLLESIGNLTGIALDRALLFEDTVEKSAEIQKRNRELDDFTYVVSHDLKEPLITIEGYSTIVSRDYGDRLDHEGVDYLRSIVSAAERMKRLIDDLLQLSRVGRTQADRETVPMQEALQAVLRDLDFTLRERHAKVLVPDTLPVVEYDATQLGLVLRNLISNGIKFNRSEEPLVRIDVREEPGEYVVAVTDNGIGIPAEYYERIFVIFQRLHGAGEYPGTGAGLSIVKKIVERHRGRVWVESERGRGTTFFFTIPK